MNVLSKVIGGELPLAPDDTILWRDKDNDGVVSALIQRHAGDVSHGLWLTSGRAALGCALDMTGDSLTRGVAVPAYQCDAVFKKIAARAQWRSYPLDPDLLPDIDAVCAISPGVVLTTVYFGSRGHVVRLAEQSSKIWSILGTPWIIEDRVQCIPESGPPAPGRDFVIYSLRKHYPVPDGALLIAVSDRAKQALSHWHRPNISSADLIAAKKAIKLKLAAKSARWRWAFSPPCVDDPEVNALSDCRNSERVFDEVADDRANDILPGSIGSARYIFRKNLATDAAMYSSVAGTIVHEARIHLNEWQVPIQDASSLGVPLLFPRRDIIRDAAAKLGLFLPIHWPRNRRVSPSAIADKYYAWELTLPVVGLNDDAALEMVVAMIKGDLPGIPSFVLSGQN